MDWKELLEKEEIDPLFGRLFMLRFGVAKDNRPR